MGQLNRGLALRLDNLMALKFLGWVKELAAHQGGDKEGVHCQGDHLVSK